MSGEERRRTVCRLSELEVGRVTPANLGRGRILLARMDDTTVHAFAARCPHQGADLSTGCVGLFVTGDHLNDHGVDAARAVVRCPWHGFEYDLKTGEPTAGSPAHRPMRLRRFDVEIDGDEVVVVS